MFADRAIFRWFQNSYWGHAKIFSAGLLALLFTSCGAITTYQTVRSEPEVFRVGELEVRLYSDRERMVQSLPPIFTLLSATRVGNIQIQVSGYCDKENKRIYAINDAKTVLHEFKHYLEPEWRHGTESPAAEKILNSPGTKSSAVLVSAPLSQTAIRD